MKYRPGQLNKRVELLQPRSTKNAVGNTLAEHTSYGTRYAAKLDASSTDTSFNDTDTALRGQLWVVRYDSLIQVSWIVRYDSQDYYVTGVVDPDNGSKRYLELQTQAVDSVTLVS